MSDATNEAVLKLYDHLTNALHLIREQEVRLQTLEDQAARHQRLIDANTGQWAQATDEAAELRDFVHGLNDRHTHTQLSLRALRIRLGEGATAPVAEVSDRA